jgi:hypothetical protein
MSQSLYALRNWLLIFAAIACALPSHAAELIRPQFLLDAPTAQAAVVARLPANTQAVVLERRGGWTRVRADGREGWLRVLALREGGASGVSAGGLLSALGKRERQPRHTSVAGLRGLEIVPSRVSAHALILTIGDYWNGIPRLNGVAHDADSAALMARALGVPEDNVTALSDAALTLNGLRAALDGLEQRVLANDEVFIYYSGHGTRLQADDGRDQRCAEALLSVDGEVLLDSELEQRLQRIASKARRLVVFIDACHAGGVSVRDTGDERFTGKFFAKAGAEPCERPVNVLTRAMTVVDAAEDAGKGKRNFVHIAAARDNEVALDDGLRGGLATQAWLDCLSGAATDLDGSTGLSAREIQACAQPRIEQLASGHSRFSPHHLTLHGNLDMVLGSPDELPLSVEPAAVLHDIHANRDDRRVVRLTADKPAYTVKQDRVKFTLQSSHGGYVYLLMAGSDGKHFDLLFPNKRDQRNLIQANETWNLPRAGWTFRAGGPAGANQLLAIVSDQPRDFSSIGMRPAGPFSVIGVTPLAARDIQFVSAGDSAGAPPECAMTGAARSQDIAAACSDGYGADLITLMEID